MPHLACGIAILSKLYPSTLGYGHQTAVFRIEWARPDLNWRSSPCQGDVITPRPRALQTVRKQFAIWMIRWSAVESTDDF